MIQICSGITSDRVLNGELYAQRLQKLIYLYLLTGSFKISLQSSEQNVPVIFLYWFRIGDMQQIRLHFAQRIEEKYSWNSL